MRAFAHRLAMFAALGCVLPTLSVAAAAQDAKGEQAQAGPAQEIAAGKALAFDRAKGNCLACHTIKGGDVASTVGPELSGIKARFPNPADLDAILQDEETRNPQTVMPAFGKNYILDAKQIQDIVAFLYTL